MNRFNDDPPRTAANRPSIVEVVGEYVRLRKAGAEYRGLCPFHAEKTGSFSVNADKGLYHCFGCGAGGDVVSFIQQIENLDFKQAIAWLGVESFRPSPQKIRARERAGLIVGWARDVSIRLRAALREISQEVYVLKMARELPEADKPLLADLEASLRRRWELLCDYDDDVNSPELVLSMRGERQNIESLLGAIE